MKNMEKNNNVFKDNIKRRKVSAFTVIICALLILYCLSLIIPAGWGLMTSLKDKWAFRADKFGFPKELKFSNYVTVIRKFYVEIETTGEYTSRKVFVLEMLYNSLVYSVGLSLVGTFITAIMAYATARFKYRSSKMIYTLVIVTMILPIVGSLPSELAVARSLGLFDSVIGMLVMKSYFFGLYFLVLYSTFEGIPRDYSEAAQIDGANNLTVMFRIMFPFIRNVFFTIFILKFIGYWNDYQTPLLFMPSRPTLAYGLYHFANEFHDNEIKGEPMQLAACFLMAVPIFILFLALQKRLMGNLSMGGLKG